MVKICNSIICKKFVEISYNILFSYIKMSTDKNFLFFQMVMNVVCLFYVNDIV